MSNPPDLSGFKRGCKPIDFAPNPPVLAPEYNPFAALGLDPTRSNGSGSSITAEDVSNARRRAARHRHETALSRFPETATAFPSMAQVNAAYDYLLDRMTNIRSATAAWAYRHNNVFFPQYELGDPHVFGAAPLATASGSRSSASATARSSCPACPATSTANGFQRSSATGASTTAQSSRPARCPAAIATAPSTPTGTHEQLIELSSDESNNPTNRSPSRESNPEDEDEEDDNMPLPSLTRERRPYRGPITPLSSPRVRRARGSGSGSVQRSSSSRHTSIANPITNDRIIVGIWLPAAGSGNPGRPNAVAAGFDQRGRVFYRITNRDLAGNTVTAPNATATNFQDIRLRRPYQNMNPAQLRLAVDRHLRLPADRRP